jgi:hypothetical protein
MQVAQPRIVLDYSEHQAQRHMILHKVEPYSNSFPTGTMPHKDAVAHTYLPSNADPE